jgi:hypothetical protein
VRRIACGDATARGGGHARQKSEAEVPLLSANVHSTNFGVALPSTNTNKKEKEKTQTCQRGPRIRHERNL